MGCDIHVHVEVKINGKWHHFNQPRVQRWYALFAKMAGVRNDGDIEPIAEPRGLPKNATVVTKFMSDRDGVDGHSHSWLSVAEMAELSKWWRAHSNDKPGHGFEGEFGYLFGTSWEGWLKWPEERCADGVEDVRCVFWFDN